MQSGGDAARNWWKPLSGTVSFKTEDVFLWALPMDIPL